MSGVYGIFSFDIVFLGPQCRDEQAGRGQSDVWDRAPLTRRVEVEDEPEKNEEDNLTDDREEEEEEEEDDARSSCFSRDDSGDSGGFYILAFKPDARVLLQLLLRIGGFFTTTCH